MSPLEHCIFCEYGYLQSHATVTVVQTYSKKEMSSHRVEIIDLADGLMVLQKVDTDCWI